jgi:peptidoglycan/xylan/chitin deacetylase (PgdA/CDA1 family)
MTVPASRILLYHKVSNDPIDSQLLAVSPTNFRNQLVWLKEHYEVLDLSYLIHRMKRKQLCGNEIAITFDDGYRDNFTQMLPIVTEIEIPVTVFIATDFINYSHEFWWDQVEQIVVSTQEKSLTLRIEDCEVSLELSSATLRICAIDTICAELKKYTQLSIRKAIEDLAHKLKCSVDPRVSHGIMTESDLSQMSESKWVTLGSHTCSHCRMTILSDSDQKDELNISKRRLEEIVEQEIYLISYPYGSSIDFSASTEKLVIECGYIAGIANIQEDLSNDTNITAIPRRLVRNWNRDDFITWMNNPVGSGMERKALQNRSRRLYH